MNSEIKKLQEEIAALKARNKKVEANKKWEMSWIRRTLVALLTYGVMVIFMMVAQYDQPFLGALIPTIAYLISMSTLTFFKNCWLKKLDKKGVANISLILGLVFTFPFASSIAIQQQTIGKIYSDINEVPDKEYVLVLGAAAYGDRLSDVLADRMIKGIEVYESKKANKMILSGGANEVVAMKKFALQKGVKEEDIISDPDGLNTYLSFLNNQTKKEMVVVTQAFHLNRGVFIANSFGLNAVGYIADRQPYLNIFHYKKRELLASSKALLMAIAGNKQ